ncbi:MAG: hypothetical protein R3F60_21665 [bacterium]
MPRALLDRLLRLHRALPAPSPMLAPFEVDPHDMIDLQRAARRLARHVGLGDLTFVVAVTPKPPDVAGHVELRYAQREVFIEISDRLLTFPRAVLACLAHEVTHKYLHSHGIWLPDLLENERLTDTAAVFNGLGRLLIAGCEDVVVEESAGLRRVHHFKGGYLERPELAEAYCAVLLARGEAVEVEGLPAPAVEAVRAARQRVAPRLKGASGLADAIERRVRTEQTLLAGAERDLRELEERAARPASFLAARHTELRLNQDELARFEEATRRPGANGGASAGLATRSGRPGGAALRGRPPGWGAVRQAADALRRAPGGAVPPDPEALRQLVCGACAEARLLADKAEVLAKCPHCTYRFLADTTIAGPPDPPPRRWWQR